MRASVLLIPLLLLACRQEPPIGQTSLDEAVEFKPPAGFQRQEVQGIDSEIREYHARDARLILSWGWYEGGLPTCRPGPACNYEELEVDGREGVAVNVARQEYEVPRLSHFYHAAFNFGKAYGDGPDMILSIRGHCVSEAACRPIDQAVKAMRFRR